ncbi:MAG TPA: protein phosphatase 2C domain-containing protein [Candidatus Dormibacteraeota bacterium]|jgi:protein phosphatase|nr:protein phosphatase 2C domain-containing protein [Candidatus Dormibacteraeota bacterium]
MTDPPRAGLGELVVEFASLSETGPVRGSNEDSLGFGPVAPLPGVRLASPSRAPVERGPGAFVAPSLVELPPGLPHHVGGGAGGHTPAGVRGGCASPPAAGLLFAVADGLGAYGGGDVASRLAVENLLGHCRDAAADSRAPGMLRGAFDRANRAVFDAALSGAGARKMQTTMTALLLAPGEGHVAHVGDCRLYRLRAGALDLLTTDHTQVMEMLRLRMISPEQAVDHPGRYALTRSLGGDLIVRTDVRREPVLDGDTFLIGSDGLWGKVDAAEIQEAMAGDLGRACAGLVERAVERGGEDNSTLVAVRVVSAGVAAVRPQGWRRFFQS